MIVFTRVAWIISVLVSLSITAGAIYVIIHFLLKIW